MNSSLRAVLFDFDGVLADTEPLHLRMFQQVLKEEGIPLTQEAYYDRFLGLDDGSCFEAVYEENRKILTGEKKGELTRKKNASLLQKIREEVQGRSRLLQGVPEFLEFVQKKYYTAVVSGALRSEVVEVLRGAGIEKKFQVLITAEDVSQGKPHPEGFLTAIRLLNRDFVPTSEILLPPECLVIEDSSWGIEAARAAGAKCLALLTSYTREKLARADLIMPNLKHVKWEKVEELFQVR